MGEELGEHSSCAGETGADDSDVAFDCGPFGGADVVIWMDGLVRWTGEG